MLASSSEGRPPRAGAARYEPTRVAIIGFEPQERQRLQEALQRAAASQNLAVQVADGRSFSVPRNVQGAILRGRPRADEAWLLEVPCLGVVPADATQQHLYSLVSSGIRDFVPTDASPREVAERFLEVLSQAAPAGQLQLSAAVVDDDEFSRDALLMSVGSANLAKVVQGFADAAGLLEEAAKFDLFVVDIVLGRQSGVQLIEQLRRRFPAALVVGVSMAASVGLQQSVLAAGADEFLVKPIHPRQLKLTVHRLAQARRSNASTS